MVLDGHYLFKTGSATSHAVGDYYMLRAGFWVKLLAGNLWAGPYVTADGAVFVLVT